MQTAHDEFAEATDPFIVWLRTDVVDGPDAFVPCGEFIAAYKQHAAKQGHTVSTTLNAIGNALRRARPKVQMTQKTMGNKRDWCYSGIRLQNALENAHSAHTA